MYDYVVKELRTAYCEPDLLRKAADAIEERDKYALTLQHEMMAEAESHIAFVERLNKQIDYLQEQVAYWQAKLVESMCGESLLESEKPRWVPVTERLPEESKGLNFHEDLTIRFASVWCCDVNTGTINVRNRFQRKKTGIQFLDQNIRDTDWHWSNSWWEPTHWMPIVPLPEPPKEEA